jgi:ribosomal protein L29
MNRTIERRVRAIETKRHQTELRDMSDEALDRRIRELEAGLLQHCTPEDLRAEMRAMGCSEALLDFMPTRGERSHAAY